MIRRIKYAAWLWLHDHLEMLWHWVYRNGVLPNAPPFPCVGNVVYTKIFENEQVTIYRY